MLESSSTDILFVLDMQSIRTLSWCDGDHWTVTLSAKFLLSVRNTECLRALLVITYHSFRRPCERFVWIKKNLIHSFFSYNFIGFPLALFHFVEVVILTFFFSYSYSFLFFLLLLLFRFVSCVDVFGNVYIFILIF